MSKIAVYPYRSANGGRALRYSLRSLQKHAPKIERVLIIGDREPWLKDAEVLDYPHHPELDNISNVIAKLHAACGLRLSPGEHFWLLNDDFYLLEPLKQINATLGQASKSPTKPGVYARIFDETLSRLAKSGHPLHEIIDYETHAPQLMEVSTVQAVIAKWGIHPYAYRTMIGNWKGHLIQTEVVQDAKTRAEFRQPAAHSPWFSSSNPTEETPGYAAWMAKTFPTPSRWEAGS